MKYQLNNAARKLPKSFQYVPNLDFYIIFHCDNCETDLYGMWKSTGWKDLGYSSYDCFAEQRARDKFKEEVAKEKESAKALLTCPICGAALSRAPVTFIWQI